MKNKKVVFIILGILLVIIFTLVLAYHFRDRRTYELNLPQIEEIIRIELERKADGVALFGIEEIEDVRNVLYGVKRITETESIQDSPVNVDNEIKINFYFDEENCSTVFVYKKNFKYYIEQPYNGIYRISADEYNSIEKYIKVTENKDFENTIKSDDENSKKYSKIIDNVNLELNIPNEWKYTEMPKNEENDFYKFALKLYKNIEEQYAVVYFYNNPFGVCGTGRTSTNITLNNGKEAIIGYYDGNKNWSDISFYNMNRYIAVINYGLINDDAKEVIDFIKTINIIEDYSEIEVKKDDINVEFVRTYHVVSDLRKSDQTGNYSYYVIEKFQYDNPIVIKVEKKYKLEENANYEFTFKGGIDELKTDYSMEEIFDQFRIINIQKTDKEGLEQRQDEIY